MTRYPLFDVFRLLLALEVVRYHAVYPSPLLLPAVPAFLALSGFLVLQSFEHSRSWGHFAWKRACRIVPAFLLMLVLVYALFGASDVGRVLAFWATLGQNGDKPVNGPVWSLGWEELYYVLLGCLFTLGAYKRLWLIVLFAVLASVFSLAAWNYVPGGFSRWPIPLASAFFIGNAMYLLRDKLASFRWLGVPLLGAGAYVEATTQFSALSTLLVAPGLLLLAVGFGRSMKWRVPDLSYGCYIYHRPLSYAFGFGLTFGLALTAICVGSYYLVEKPALAFKNLRRTKTAPTLERAEAAIV